MPRRHKDALILTMLGAALLIALGWLGWEYQIVRHRRAMRAQIEADGGVVLIGRFDLRESSEIETIRPPDFHYKISAVRKWFGDKFVDLIAFRRKLTEVDRHALEAFPESEVHAIP